MDNTNLLVATVEKNVEFFRDCGLADARYFLGGYDGLPRCLREFALRGGGVVVVDSSLASSTENLKAVLIDFAEYVREERCDVRVVLVLDKVIKSRDAEAELAGLWKVGIYDIVYNDPKVQEPLKQRVLTVINTPTTLDGITAIREASQPKRGGFLSLFRKPRETKFLPGAGEAETTPERVQNTISRIQAQADAASSGAGLGVGVEEADPEDMPGRRYQADTRVEYPLDEVSPTQPTQRFSAVTPTPGGIVHGARKSNPQGQGMSAQASSVATGADFSDAEGIIPADFMKRLEARVNAVIGEHEQREQAALAREQAALARESELKAIVERMQKEQTLMFAKLARGGREQRRIGVVSLVPEAMTAEAAQELTTATKRYCSQIDARYVVMDGAKFTALSAIGAMSLDDSEVVKADVVAIDYGTDIDSACSERIDILYLVLTSEFWLVERQREAYERIGERLGAASERMVVCLPAQGPRAQGIVQSILGDQREFVCSPNSNHYALKGATSEGFNDSLHALLLPLAKEVDKDFDAPESNTGRTQAKQESSTRPKAGVRKAPKKSAVKQQEKESA